MQCTKCGVVQPEFEFTLRRSGKRRTDCKACRRAYTNAHYAANRERRRAQLKASTRRRTLAMREHIKAVKATSGCVDCGEVDPIVLEFDHLRDKEFNLAHYAKASWERLHAEIAKCEVVCANCHRRRTHSRRTGEDGITPPL